MKYNILLLELCLLGCNNQPSKQLKILEKKAPNGALLFLLRLPPSSKDIIKVQAK